MITAAKAKALLAKRGKVGVLKRTVGAEYDRDTDSMVGGKTTKLSVTYVVTLASRKPTADELVSGTSKVLIVAGDVEVAADDNIDGFIIDTFDTIAPAGVPIVHFCTVKK